MGRTTHSTSMRIETAMYVIHAAAHTIRKAPTALDLDDDIRILGRSTLRFHGHVPEASKWYTLETQRQEICCRDKCKECHESPCPSIKNSVCGRD